MLLQEYIIADKMVGKFAQSPLAQDAANGSSPLDG